jgi:hypothetical protein
MMTAADKFTWGTYDTLLRRDFVSFAQRCFCELSPRTAFLMNWHIEIIAAKLMAVRMGQIRRMIINMPPRYLKSLLASVAFPAWCLGHDPAAQILCAGARRQIVARLPADPAERLVLAALPDAPLARAAGGGGVRRRAAGSPPRWVVC